MKPEKFLELFGNIDDKFVQEANSTSQVTPVSSVPRKNWIKYLGIAASLIIVSGIALVLVKFLPNDGKAISTSETTVIEDTSGMQPQNPTGVEPTGLEPTGAGPTDTNLSGDGCGTSSEIVLDGICILIEGYDYWVNDENGYEFISENYESIRSSLVVSGINAENLVINDHGYAHMETDISTVKVNWRDFLAYNDGELVAIVTVMNDEDGMTYFLAFGAPWFEAYDSFLREHSGEELVYLYVGTAEAVVTPDNEIFFTTTLAQYQHYVEGYDYYIVLNQGVNSYVPYADLAESYPTPTTTAQDAAPTGVSEGQIEQPTIYYQGNLYCYNYQGVQTTLASRFTSIGTIVEVDLNNLPTEDLHATGVDLQVGQEVYAETEENPSVLFVNLGDMYMPLYVVF